MSSLMGDPGSQGRFGEYGGRFVPESLMPACMELETAFREAWLTQNSSLNITEPWSNMEVGRHR